MICIPVYHLYTSTLIMRIMNTTSRGKKSTIPTYAKPFTHQNGMDLLLLLLKMQLSIVSTSNSTDQPIPCCLELFGHACPRGVILILCCSILCCSVRLAQSVPVFHAIETNSVSKPTIFKFVHGYHIALRWWLISLESLVVMARPVRSISPFISLNLFSRKYVNIPVQLDLFVNGVFPQKMP